MTARVFDDRTCALGEGPLWHPEREQLFWFDILGKQLLTRDENGPSSWSFDEYVSAAGWIDHDTLLIATQSGLSRFDIATGDKSRVAALEQDNAITRSNDGRADPWGGFWIGTMGINAEEHAGSIYRYYKGELRKIIRGITISNSIAFAPDRSVAYYTDTPSRQIMQVSLSATDGWPIGAPTLCIDLNDGGFNPDGSVVDSEGCIWNAQWGAGRVARYTAAGALIAAYDLPATQATCPAFGGDDLRTLFVTTAAQDINGDPDGRTFQISTDTHGQKEHRVIL